MNTRAFGITLLCCAAVTLGAPVAAQSSVTIGSNLLDAPSGMFVVPVTVANSSLPAASMAPGGLTAPTNGVVVSWSIRKNGVGGPSNTVRLVILSGNTSVGQSPVQSLPTTGISGGVFSYPARLPIAAGERIGLETGGGTVRVSAAPVGGIVDSWNPPLGAGAGRPPDDSGSSDLEVLVNALVEPDLDADGFGDESQDGCSGVAGPTGGCPILATAPDTEITAGPGKKIKKTTAEFTFGSSDSTASFECSLDQGGFMPCKSPTRLKRLRSGKHDFKVRAVSAGGLIDLTPATASFKVKKQQGKKK